ncbi:nuclear transport factor 2 family protein [Pseudoxanthomonas sp.]|uniref:nuclear transport factor 2 family protein n=1 Tax=Pseudoxanthomonas sp. TaxID=1871049 RepID=UPI00262CA636|nr:nuclear transport factor 2 family protein [Pseudoxanthomonas sp.]WDS36935.1 MAG: nuclear transport factor 2 family protein [Pseudoxanthomonas sp.]
MNAEALAARLQAVEDRIAIQDVVSASTLHSDLNEGARSLAQFTRDAVIDYSSLSGPGSAGIPIHEHARNLSAFLPGFERRQHCITNFQITVTGDSALARSQCHAIHVLGNEVWEARATYYHALVRTQDGWKISVLRAEMIHQSGEQLVERAREIVAQRRSAVR